jgi:hypothetical protein
VGGALTVAKVREEALVLLRGLIIKTDKNPGAWPHLSVEAQATVKTALLTALENEASDKCRGYLCDLVGELGSLVLAAGV